VIAVPGRKGFGASETIVRGDRALEVGISTLVKTGILRPMPCVSPAEMAMNRVFGG